MTGYCSTGSLRSVTKPKTIVTIAITFANTGRSMKKREITSGVSRAALGIGGRRRGRLAVRRLDLASGSRALEPVHDDPVALPHPLVHHPHRTFDDRAQVDAPVLDHVLVVHDEQILAALVGRHGGLGNEQRRAMLH